MIPIVILFLWLGGIILGATLFIFYALSVREWVRMSRWDGKAKYHWMAFGIVYCAIAFICLYDIAMHPPLIWLPLCIFISVWLSDTSAYLFGKTFGGKKLAPKISPNKTWAGLVGACVGPAVALFLFQIIYDQASGFDRDFSTMTFFVLSLEYGVVIGCAGQIGDLLVSWLKRKSGQKDSGTLIPGHGGLLDRIDALLLVSIIFWIWMQFGGYQFLFQIEDPWIPLWSF